MNIPIFQVDAFATKPFQGNPAAVCPLEKWLDDDLMQNIAEENNLAETAFIVPTADGFHIRWFTPTVEVDLCGHATLAAAFVLFDRFNEPGDVIHFASRSGPLSVARDGDKLTLNFPEQPLAEQPLDSVSGLSLAPLFCGSADDLVAVLASEAEVANYQPDLAVIATLPFRGLLITAPGTDCDFVCRGFFPQSGINEDPATGSAYTELAPYWAPRLGKTSMSAKQLSKRGANIDCELADNSRVLISGYAKLYLTGSISIE